ncbi:Kelch motif family protein [Histomonas meleagridis]|uniref:Kelch motif family protein n=1 Tax=Histomonas meleagridis TaxID=135588 RepID=UPI00355A3E22|nr:Kelch motif family protein [Histomonas meleagridis]KAH0802628.1 Kelch motif family protein [Histomonas meleagridis]
MGSDISSPTNFSDVYVPMGGIRLNSEKDKENNLSSQAPQRTRRSHIVKTFFSGVWSVETIASDLAPPPRTGQFTCFSEYRKSTIIGFGIDDNGNYYNDIWLFDVINRAWSNLNLSGIPISPRSGSRGVAVENMLFVIGGVNGLNYYNDIYSIDLNTGFTQIIETNGNVPTPRSSFVLSSYGTQLFLWGGYNGTWPSELYVLDLNSLTWEMLPKDVMGRSNSAFEVVDHLVYIYGSSKTGGLLVINMIDRSIETLPTTGPEPSPSLLDATLVHFDTYLMFIGGKSSTTTTFLYALDLNKMRWFMFHILPDGDTLSAADGTINELGMFMIPRTYSLSAVYDASKREIIAFLGHPAMEQRNLTVLGVGEALAALHLRSDMYDVIQHQENMK